MKTKHLSLRPRFRIEHGTTIAFGPGKADLLEALQRTGSITRAAAQMGMSYMRAWTLIRTMNKCFREPLVVSARGGMKGGGGAHMTETGSQALTLYRQIEEKSLKTVQPDWKRFRRLLQTQRRH